LSLSRSGAPTLAYHHGNLKEALLERAAELIAERGVEALSLRGLARDLGVSHAAPSAHFADRTALLCALAKEGFRRSVDAMRAGAEAVGPDPVARYRALGRSYVAFALENPSYFRAINHPEVRAHGDAELAEAQADFFATLRDGVEAAQAAGWHPEIATETLLAFSCAAATGAAELLADPISCRQLGVRDVDALADSVLELVVHRGPASPLSSSLSKEDLTADPAAANRRNLS
jgi:AcrR family transcriptional regulator